MHASSLLKVVLLVGVLATCCCQPDTTSATARARRGPNSVGRSGREFEVSSEPTPDLGHQRQKSTTPTRKPGRPRPSPVPLAKEEPSQQEKQQESKYEVPKRISDGSRSRSGRRRIDTTKQQQQSGETETRRDNSREQIRTQSRERATTTRQRSSSSVRHQQTASRDKHQHKQNENIDHDIDEEDNYPEHFKQQILSSKKPPEALSTPVPQSAISETSVGKEAHTPRVSSGFARGRNLKNRQRISTVPESTTLTSATTIRLRTSLLRDSARSRNTLKTREEQTTETTSVSVSSTEGTVEQLEVDTVVDRIPKLKLEQTTETTISTSPSVKYLRARNFPKPKEIQATTEASVNNANTDIHIRGRKVSRVRSNLKATTNNILTKKESEEKREENDETVSSSNVPRVSSRERNGPKHTEDTSSTEVSTTASSSSTTTRNSREYVRRKNKIKSMEDQTEASTTSTTSAATPRAREYVRVKSKSISWDGRTTEALEISTTIRTPRREYIRTRSFIPRSKTEQITEASITSESTTRGRKYTRTRSFTTEVTDASSTTEAYRGRKYSRARSILKTEEDQGTETTIHILTTDKIPSTKETEELESKINNENEKSASMTSAVDTTTSATSTARVRYSAKHRRFEFPSEQKDINDTSKSKHRYSSKFRSSLFLPKSSTTPSSDDIAQTTEASDEEAARRLREKFPLLSSRIPNKRTYRFSTLTPTTAIASSTETARPESIETETARSESIESETMASSTDPYISDDHLDFTEANLVLEKVLKSPLRDETISISFSTIIHTTPENGADMDSYFGKPDEDAAKNKIIASSASKPVNDLIQNTVIDSENTKEIESIALQVPKGNLSTLTETDINISGGVEPVVKQLDFNNSEERMISSTKNYEFDNTISFKSVELRDSISTTAKINISPPLRAPVINDFILQDTIPTESSTANPITTLFYTAPYSKVTTFSNYHTTITPTVTSTTPSSVSSTSTSTTSATTTSTTHKPTTTTTSTTSTPTTTTSSTTSAPTTTTTSTTSTPTTTTTSTTSAPTTTTSSTTSTPTTTTTSTTSAPTTTTTSTTSAPTTTTSSTTSTPTTTTTSTTSAPTTTTTSTTSAPTTTTSSTTSAPTTTTTSTTSAPTTTISSTTSAPTTTTTSTTSTPTTTTTSTTSKPTITTISSTPIMYQSRFAMRIPIAPPGTMSSTPVPLARQSKQDHLNSPKIITAANLNWFLESEALNKAFENMTVTPQGISKYNNSHIISNVNSTNNNFVVTTSSFEGKRNPSVSSLENIIRDANAGSNIASSRVLSSIAPPGYPSLRFGNPNDIKNESKTITTKDRETYIYRIAPDKQTKLNNNSAKPIKYRLLTTDTPSFYTTQSTTTTFAQDEVRNTLDVTTKEATINTRTLTVEVTTSISTAAPVTMQSTTTTARLITMNNSTATATPSVLTNTFPTISYSTTTTMPATTPFTTITTSTTTTKTTPPPTVAAPTTTTTKTIPTTTTTTARITTTKTTPRATTTSTTTTTARITTTKTTPRATTTPTTTTARITTTKTTPRATTTPTTTTTARITTTKAIIPTTTTRIPTTTRTITTLASTTVQTKTSTAKTITISPPVQLTSKIPTNQDVTAPLQPPLELPDEDSVGLTDQDLQILALLSQQRLNTATVEHTTAPSQNQGLLLANLLAETQQRTNSLQRAASTRRPINTVHTSTGQQQLVQSVDSTLFGLLRQISSGSFGFAQAPVTPVREEPVVVEPSTSTLATRPLDEQEQRTPKRLQTKPRATTPRPTIHEPQPVEPTGTTQSALVTVAINVTRTMAGLMGRVLQGAARTVSAVVSDSGRVISNYLQTWQIPVTQ